MSIEFSVAAKDRLKRLLEQYPTPRNGLLPALQLAQEEFGCISPEVEDYVSGLLQIPAAAIRELVSFYTLLHKEPPGKHVLHLCRNLPCHLRGGREIQAYVERKLGIEAEGTTPDGRLTLLQSECLGACEDAPMMMLDGKYYGPLTPEYVDRILDPILSGG